MAKFLYRQFVAPIPFSTRTGKDSIVITSAALIKSSRDLSKVDFSYYYGLELDESARVRTGITPPYVLNHYITFGSKSKMSKPDIDDATYDIFYFQVIFKKDVEFVLPSQSQYMGENAKSLRIPIKEIDAVRVFLVDVDPDASRGTETQVQQGGG